MDEIQKILEDSYRTALEAYNSFKDYSIEIGVVSGNSNRKQSLKYDINNAELMYIHEHGSPLKNIPARPVLQLTIQYTIQELLPKTLKAIDEGCFNRNWTKADVKRELEMLCVRMQNYARTVIYRSDLLAPNAQSTIRGKKSDRPLLNTGQLARSITCRLIKRSN